MRRHGSGIALSGPISGKPDIGDAVPAGRGITHPLLPGGAGPRPEALGPPARSSLMVRSSLRRLAARSAARTPQRHRDGAPRGAASFARGRTHRKVRCLMRRHAALHPLGLLPGARKGKAACPGPQRTRAMARGCNSPPPTLSRPQLSGIPPQSAASGRCFAATFLAWSAHFQVEVKRPLKSGHPRRFRAPGRGFPRHALFKSGLRQP